MSKPTDAASLGLFVHSRRISWADADAAQIVYTARVPGFAVEAIEAWFVERLGFDWYHLNIDHEIGTPFVHLDVDFRSPMRPGETIRTTVRLARVGRSSLHFRLDCRESDSERLCWEANLSCTFVDVKTCRSIPIPALCRAQIDAEAALAASASALRHPSEVH